jgi:two-component system, LytTR family, response regulator
MTLRVLVADDEAPARRRLLRLLGAIPELDVVGEATNGEQAVERIAALEPDLVLLDIQMPILDGFDVVATIGVDEMPAVIFVTAYDEHALRAFEAGAIDYLVKPVAPTRLREAIQRVISRQPSGRTAPDFEAGDMVSHRSKLASLVGKRHLRRLMVKDDRGARLLAVETIELARAERNYVALHTSLGVFRIRGTVSALSERLDQAAFLRVNRSDIVRLDAIRELQPWSHGDYRVLLANGTALLWSRRFRAQTVGAFDLA